jgi:hypothetical protein
MPPRKGGGTALGSVQQEHAEDVEAPVLRREGTRCRIVLLSFGRKVGSWHQAEVGRRSVMWRRPDLRICCRRLCRRRGREERVACHAPLLKRRAFWQDVLDRVSAAILIYRCSSVPPPGTCRCGRRPLPAPGRVLMRSGRGDPRLPCTRCRSRSAYGGETV